MANSPRSLCRNCLGFVSRFGSLTPEPPPSTTGRGGGDPIPEASSKHHSVASAAVIVASLAALIGIMMVIAVLIRRKRIREQLLYANAAGAVEGAAEAKGGDGDAAQGQNGKWSADAELVVMAGEKSPTFVAHPVPAFSDSVVVQCPPFTLPKDPQ